MKYYTEMLEIKYDLSAHNAHLELHMALRTGGFAKLIESSPVIHISATIWACDLTIFGVYWGILGEHAKSKILIRYSILFTDHRCKSF